MAEAIYTYKTGRSLVELQDCLIPAAPCYARRLHAFPVKGEETKLYSRFKFLLIDYSKGSGENSVCVDVNITAETLIFLFWQYKYAIQTGNFAYTEEKIMPNNDLVKKLTIRRAKTNSKGEVLRNPWSISAESGKGQKAYTKEGGTYLKPGTYQKERSVYVSLSDKDMFLLLNEGRRRLEDFETYYGSKLLSMSAKNADEEDKQIYRITTKNSLVEFVDKTNTIYNGKSYRVIGINIVDFNKKNNGKNLFLSLNLSTQVCGKIYSDIRDSFNKDYEYNEEKIMPNADVDGYSKVSKFKVVRSQFDKNGEVRKSPWFIVIEQGKAQLQEFANGAKAIKGGTYIKESMAYVPLTDKDMLAAFYNVNRLICAESFLRYCKEQGGNKNEK